jgi:hypothetical protein
MTNVCLYSWTRTPRAARCSARSSRPPGRVPCRCMTTYAPHDRALDERTRQAWSSYREGLADLTGRDYADAEADAWDRLQEALGEIDADRAASHTGGDHPA